MKSSHNEDNNKHPITQLAKQLVAFLQAKRTFVIVGILLAVILMIALTRDDQTSTDSSSSTNVETYQNPLKGASLYANPLSNAAKQADSWRVERPEDAEAMSRLATLPAAKWLTSADSVDETLETYLAGADRDGSTAILVAYNIPFRDCGLYSAGGADDLAGYKAYIDSLATAIADRSAIVIIEPDALANINANGDNGKPCLSADERQLYYQAFNYAVDTLGSLAATNVYLDAGNSAWIKNTPKLAESLRKAGIAKADGFSLNVSNFQTNDQTIEYGTKLSAELDGKHFVIDTSRNGLGAYKNPVYEDFSWCNPPDRALGHYPTVDTGESLVDAYLYIKAPGESDGEDSDPNKCFGGPRAGGWWPEYALGLLERWPKDLQPR